MRISKIILYDEPAVPEIDLEGASEFVEDMFKVASEKRGPILATCDNNAIYEIAASRIHVLHWPFQKHRPSAEEIKFERKNIADTSATENIVCYDGFELQNAFGRLIPREELSDDIFHIIFTNKMTCTYDDTDNRYHGRALIGSNPSIISTTGIIEAPAKPREYYMEMAANARRGINIDVLKERFGGKSLRYHDPRLDSIVHGYILQAVFYYETQEAFCDRTDCRLYNAHWQSDLLYSQLESGGLCKRHQNMIEHMIAS